MTEKQFNFKPAENTTEKLLYIESIFQELENNLSIEAFEKINKYIDFTTDLLLKLELDLDKLKKNSHLYERITILTYLVKSWTEDRSNINDSKVLAKKIQIVFPEYLRNRKKISIKDRPSHGSHEIIVASLLINNFPEVLNGSGINSLEEFSKLNSEEIYKVINHVKEYMKNKLTDNENPILQFPYRSSEEAVSSLKQIFEILDAPKTLRNIMSAASWGERVLLFFPNIPKRIINHELNHSQNEGLAIGRLGVSLNEGMTDLLAFRKTYPKKLIRRWKLAVEDSYWEEIQLVLELMKSAKNPKNVEEALLARYAQINKETSMEFINQILLNFDLDTFGEIFFANPFDQGMKDHASKTDKLLTSDTESVRMKIRQRFRQSKK